MNTPNTVSEMEEVFRGLEQSRFYGSLEIKFEAGRVVLMKKTETIKPSNCRYNRGQHYEQQ